MKSRPIRVALIAAVALTSPLLAFAADRPPIHVPSKTEMQNRDGITRAVQQGKGGGMPRNQEVRANAYRSQTAAENQVVKEKPKTGYPNWGDTAFRK